VFSQSVKGLCAILLALLASTATRAESRSAASLLPENTKGYVSVPNLNQLLETWGDTQLGQLLEDQQLRPFVDQILASIRDNGSSLQLRLGVSLSDLEPVTSGELCLAAMEPAGEDTFATVIICNVEGRATQVRALLEKVNAGLHARKATQQVKTIHTRQVTIYSVPGLHGPESGHQICYAVNQQKLIVADHVDAMKVILARWNDKSLKSLKDQPAYQEVLKRTALETGNLSWYVEPFGYARVLRSAMGHRKRGTDRVKMLQSQGFDAIAAVGGQVALKTSDHEILHRTFVYAPGDKELAARMLDFPNGSQLHPAPWIPANVNNYVALRMKMAEAFEYSASLVNAITKSDNFFEEFLTNLEQDQNGPRVNLRRDLIAHLGDEVTLISDMQEPITPKSDRFLVAVEVKDTEAVARTVAQALQADPTAKSHEINGLMIWEITNQPEDDEFELAVDVEVDGARFNFGTPRGDTEETEEAQPSLPNSAIAVIDGKLLVSSHVEFIVEVARQMQQSASESLGESADYNRVSTELSKLSTSEESFRIFSRSDDTYQATYELIRQGRVGESESLVARLLNRLNGEKGTAKHEQKMDGSKLPGFEYVRQYLGPVGAVVETQADGWMISGFLLSHEAE